MGCCEVTASVNAFHSRAFPQCERNDEDEVMSDQKKTPETTIATLDLGSNCLLTLTSKHLRGQILKFRNYIYALVGFVGLLICGCTPEETFVLVNGSALKKAAANELASAKVEMVFDINGNSDRDLPEKIKRVALPYLGTGATIEIEKTETKRYREGGSIRDEEVQVKSSLDKAKMVCRFSIPVGTEEVLNSAQKSILWLRYTPSKRFFELVPGNAVRALNSALADIDDDIKFEYNGGRGAAFSSGTTIKIVGDELVKIGVMAVDVDKKPIICSRTFPTL